MNEPRDFFARLSSRKFLFTVFTAVAALTADVFGIPKEAVELLAVLCIGYVFGEGAVDIFKKAPQVIALIVLPAMLLLSGCGGRTESEKKGDAAKRDRIINYAANMQRLHHAEQEGFRKEAYAHARTKWEWDLEKLKEKADANGNVPAADAQAWIKKITAEYEANRAVVDGKVDAVKAEIVTAERDLAVHLELDEMLNQMRDVGIAPEIVKQAGDAIGKIINRK